VVVVQRATARRAVRDPCRTPGSTPIGPFALFVSVAPPKATGTASLMSSNAQQRRQVRNAGNTRIARDSSHIRRLLLRGGSTMYGALEYLKTTRKHKRRSDFEDALSTGGATSTRASGIIGCAIARCIESSKKEPHAHSETTSKLKFTTFLR
jgi:hypothetical protein